MRLRDNPAIKDYQALAYAGYPLRAPNGAVLGAFCLVDSVRRDWTPDPSDVIGEGWAQQVDLYAPDGHTMLDELPLARAVAGETVSGQLFNAITYTPDGDTVTVTGHCRGDQVVIEVSDTGIGIPTERIPHLFSRFFRASNAISSGSRAPAWGWRSRRRSSTLTVALSRPARRAAVVPPSPCRYCSALPNADRAAPGSGA